MATVEKINDEALLTAMLIFANQASKNPEAVKNATKKPKAPMKAETKIATEVRVLEYVFQDKPYIAVQANGKPAEALLKTLRDFKEAGKIRFYGGNVPANPFGNELPFWAGKADEPLKAALMAVA